MRVRQWIASNPKWYDERPEGYDIHEEVNSIARRHTQRSDFKEFLEIERPFEDPRIKGYREAISRNITMEIADKWSSKRSRILEQSGFTCDKHNVSEDLRNHLESNPFQWLNETFDFDYWYFRCLLTYSDEDPNGYTFELPFNKANPDIAPSEISEIGGANPAEQIALRTFIVPFFNIVRNSDGIFCFCPGMMPVKRGEDTYKARFFFAVDDQAYWLLRPYYSGDELKYAPQVWYQHSDERSQLGCLPITSLPGRLKTLTKMMSVGKGAIKDVVKPYLIKYKESYLAPAFEFADELAIQFNNDQGLRVFHSNPKLVMGSSECDKCEGTGWSKEIIKGEVKKEKCGPCQGSGRQKLPGPYGVFNTSKNREFDGNNTGKDFYYVNVPTEPLEMSWKAWQELRQIAKQSVGLDLLEGSFGDSGTALERRESVLLDLLREQNEDVHRSRKQILWIKEKLLVINESRRQMPQVPMGTDFDFRSSEELRKQAMETSCPELFMKYVKNEHRDNPQTVRAYDLYLEYAPLKLMDRDDIGLRLDEGAFTTDDLIRRDRGYWAIKKVLEDPANIVKDKKEIFDLADEELRRCGYLKSDEFVEEIEGGGSESDEIKRIMDAYGVGVRAGVITPTIEDEERFRQLLGIQGVSEEIRQTWQEDGGTRRPITLKAIDFVNKEEGNIDEPTTTE